MHNYGSVNLDFFTKFVFCNLHKNSSGFKSHLVLARPKPKRIRKNHPEKNSLYFQKSNFLALMLKKLLYFLKRKFFLYFLKRKFFLYFLKRKLFLYFLKLNPSVFNPSMKNKRNSLQKNFLYFRKQKTRKIYCVF